MLRLRVISVCHVQRTAEQRAVACFVVITNQNPALSRNTVFFCPCAART